MKTKIYWEIFLWETRMNLEKQNKLNRTKFNSGVRKLGRFSIATNPECQECAEKHCEKCKGITKEESRELYFALHTFKRLFPREYKIGFDESYKEITRK